MNTVLRQLQQEYRLSRFNHWDQALLMRLNRIGQRSRFKTFFALISRLGNGIFWYMLMVGMLLTQGRAAIYPVLHMVVVGLIATLIYKWLKAKTSRLRPFELNQLVLPGAATLDRFSFPSGHTLHAVTFSVIALYYYPDLVWLVVPFTLLVAASRPILGLHYPTDVIAGAAIGGALAGISLLI